jgi:hypothetical protein
VFWIGYSMALLEAFEQANNNGSPFWSSIYGFPVLHPMYYGFFFAAVAWVLIILMTCCWRIEEKK